MRRPRPARTVALLPSAGITGERRATRHIYVETLPAVLGDGSPIWEHIYACEETGAKRRWGFADRTELRASEAN